MEKENNIRIYYKNELNSIALKDFNPIEIDLFFTILSQMRDKGTKEQVFTFYELRKLSNYNKSNSVESLVNDLETTYNKLIKLNVKIGTSKKWTRFVIFTKYIVDLEKQEITISLNDEFYYLINQLTDNFTRLELEELLNLKSIYSKNAYRLLKQYRATGKAIFTIEKFRELLDIPESYEMANINQRVIEPIRKELEPYFPNLKIKKIRGNGKDYRTIKKIEFTFMNDDSLNSGKRTFRDADGNYYEKDIIDFTSDEIKKVYPTF